MKKILGVSIFLVSTTVAWPGYKKMASKQVLKDGDDDCIDTNHVHTDCGEIRPHNEGPGIHYPSAFIMSYNKWDVECPLDAADCQPPYYPSTPGYIGNRYVIKGGPGHTYYNSTYRGGSQVENYTERCVPIFPSYDANFPCTFYIIGDTHTAYLHSKGAPKAFGECCKLSGKFHAPVRNFSDGANFTGIKYFGNQKYLGLETVVPTAGGMFSYNFWKDPHVEPSTGDTYYVPAFFYYTGITPGKNPGDDPMPVWVQQEFADFSVEPFNPADHFTLPDACTPAVNYCPDFDPNASDS